MITVFLDVMTYTAWLHIPEDYNIVITLRENKKILKS